MKIKIANILERLKVIGFSNRIQITFNASENQMTFHVNYKDIKEIPINQFSDVNHKFLSIFITVLKDHFLELNNDLKFEIIEEQ